VRLMVVDTIYGSVIGEQQMRKCECNKYNSHLLTVIYRITVINKREHENYSQKKT